MVYIYNIVNIYDIRCICVCHILHIMLKNDASVQRNDHFPKAKWTTSGHPSAGTRGRFGKASGTGYNQHFLQLCPIASLLSFFCYFFDMRKPDIGSTDLIS